MFGNNGGNKMDKQIMVAEIRNGNSKLIYKVNIGKAVLYGGKISGRKFEELLRAARKSIGDMPKGRYVRTDL